MSIALVEARGRYIDSSKDKNAVYWNIRAPENLLNVLYQERVYEV